MSEFGHYEKIFDNSEYFSRLQITDELLKKFGEISGDYNPLHTNDEYAKENGFKNRVAYGNILGLLLSQLVGMHLWSKDVMLVSQRIDFRMPMYPGDIIVLKGKITKKSTAVKIVELSLTFSNDLDQIIATGKCQVRCLSK